MNQSAVDESRELSELLQQSGRQDQQAFAELYRRTSARSFGICLRMLRDRGEAEDALQSVFVAIWRRADSFDPARASPMAWLTSVTRNQCIDRLRRHREVPVDNSVTERLVDSEPDASEACERSQQRERLERCLDTLAEQQRSAIRAAFFSGATYKELADGHGVPLGTAKSWIRRGLIRLRDCLES